jgi:dTDP-4-dehydrorhamnose 3,5-epimerase
MNVFSKSIIVYHVLLLKQNVMPFEFRDTDLPGVKLVIPEVFEDDRGLFMETYVEDSFREGGIDTEFVQDNYSKSKGGVLRGLHYQKGDASQGKLIQCTEGTIYDIVVDLRAKSPTHGNTLSTILSEHNRKMLFAPKGLAHGYVTLSDSATTRYKVDNEYAPAEEAGIHWDDPELDINWPIADPIVSEKDSNWPTFDEAADSGVAYQCNQMTNRAEADD